MLFTLCNIFEKPIQKYQWGLVEEIYKQFPSLAWTKEQKLPAHFTLKYDFEAESAEQIEKLIKNFTKSHPATPVHVGGFNHFGGKTVFVKVDASPKARGVFSELITQLESVPSMQWNEHDGRDMYFHMTVSEKCEGLYEQVLDFVKDEEKHFDSSFSNISLMRHIETLPSGTRMWETYKVFEFSG